MHRLTPIIAILFSFLPLWTSGADGAGQAGETKKFSLGGGYAGSTVDVDTARDGSDSVTLSGWGVRGRVALNQRWGLQFRYLSDDDDFSSGGRLSLDQVGVQAYYKWLETEQKHFHTYVKFGLARTDFEERIPLTGTFSDDALGPAVGIGLEWGPPRFAFFVDFGLAFVDIELIPGDEESFMVGNSITGFTYRF